MGCFGGLESLFVDLLERQVQGDVADLAGVDELGSNLRGRLTDVPATVRSLIVGELDQCELGTAGTLHRVVPDIEDLALHTGPRRRRGACPIATIAPQMTTLGKLWSEARYQRARHSLS